MLYRLSTLLLLTGLATTIVTADQGPYAQCGGQGWTGGTTCTAGWTCVYNNPYYSQCLMAPSSGGQGPYEQCGGQNWSGGTTCTTGWTCVYSNPYYSQCLPATSSNSAVVVTTTTTKPPKSTTTQPTTKPTTTLKTTTTTVAPSSSTANPSSSSAAGAQGPYQQCGGQNWNGGTTCVAGWTCVYSNPYYSQCLQPSSSNGQQTTQSSSTQPPNSSSTSSQSTSAASSTSLPNSGVSYKASFTHYGAGDSFGSPNCNTNTAACFFYTQPGYSAAVSQNLYGAGPGQGQGPACGTCWRITGETDSSGNRLSNAPTTIVVMINNLCPADGNPLCAQNGLSGTNQYGANVNFDLCSDSGAAAAFFGNSGVGLAVGSATQVDCSEWSGTIRH